MWRNGFNLLNYICIKNSRSHDASCYIRNCVKLGFHCKYTTTKIPVNWKYILVRSFCEFAFSDKMLSSHLFLKYYIWWLCNENFNCGQLLALVFLIPLFLSLWETLRTRLCSGKCTSFSHQFDLAVFQTSRFKSHDPPNGRQLIWRLCITTTV